MTNREAIEYYIKQAITNTIISFDPHAGESTLNDRLNLIYKGIIKSEDFQRTFSSCKECVSDLEGYPYERDN